MPIADSTREKLFRVLSRIDAVFPGMIDLTGDIRSLCDAGRQRTGVTLKPNAVSECE